MDITTFDEFRKSPGHSYRAKEWETHYTQRGANLVYGAVHRAMWNWVLANDVASDLVGDGDSVNVVCWITNPLSLTTEPAEHWVVLGPENVGLTASPTETVRELLSVDTVAKIHRRLARYEYVATRRDEPRQGLTAVSERGWVLFKTADATRADVVLGVDIAAKKTAPPAGARVVRAGKRTIVGVSLAELKDAPWMLVDLADLTKKIKAVQALLGPKLIGKQSVQLHLVVDGEVQDIEGKPSASQKKRSTKKAVEEPLPPEPSVFKQVLSALNDVSVDSFDRPMRFETLERKDKRVVLGFTYGVRKSKASQAAEASLAWPDVVTPASSNALIEDLMLEVSSQLPVD